jgi:hypothetical protein
VHFFLLDFFLLDFFLDLNNWTNWCVILVILISTVALESTFSNEERILDPFRSSLSPLTVDALICTQDWLKNNEDLENENIIEIFDEHGKWL